MIDNTPTVAECLGPSMQKVRPASGRHTCLQIVMQNVTQPMGIALILITVRTSDEKTVSDKHRYFYIPLVSFFNDYIKAG